MEYRSEGIAAYTEIAEAPMVRGAIALEVDGLKGELSILESSVEQLRQMIDPILRPSHPENINGEAMKNGVTSAVAGSLCDIKMRVNEQNRIINDLVSRLDL